MEVDKLWVSLAARTTPPISREHIFGEMLIRLVSKSRRVAPCCHCPSINFLCSSITGLSTPKHFTFFGKGLLDDTSEPFIVRSVRVQVGLWFGIAG